MAKRTAWVITWSHNSSKQNGNFPATEPGTPLALFPGRTEKGRIEGALVALHQLIEGSYPSSGIMHVRKKSANVVEWDAADNRAIIGHDPQVIALKTRNLRHLTDSASLNPETGEGTLSFTPEVPLTESEAQARRLAALDANLQAQMSVTPFWSGQSWKAKRVHSNVVAPEEENGFRTRGCPFLRSYAGHLGLRQRILLENRELERKGLRLSLAGRDSKRPMTKNSGSNDK